MLLASNLIIKDLDVTKVVNLFISSVMQGLNQEMMFVEVNILKIAISSYINAPVSEQVVHLTFY